LTKNCNHHHTDRHIIALIIANIIVKKADMSHPTSEIVSRMFERDVAHVVVLTGAGISAESGIRTFRAADGLWEDHRVEDVASPEGFARNPELVLRFYNERRRQLHDPVIQPNAAHLALARLEEVFGERFLLVTQNVDDLHERAGSKRVIHMHGELFKARCVRSDRVVEWRGDLTMADRCTCCASSAPLRPHIVWFGEMPLEMDRIYRALAEADLFLSIGTSGHVYPAAGFVEEARRHGARTVELNLEPSQNVSRFDETIHAPATLAVPAYVERLWSMK